MVPEALRGQVKMVHGLEVDKCLSLESQTHWVKASVSHGAAVAHAKKYGYASAAVLEEDIIRAGALRVAGRELPGPEPFFGNGDAG